MAEQIKINSLVPPTWNRLKVNDVTVNMPAEKVAGTIADDVKTSPADSNDWNFETGCGADLTALLEKNGTEPVLVKTEGDKLLNLVGRKRGMLLSGGVVDTERAAITVLDDFRGAKLGRITLEAPPKKGEQA